MTAPLKRVLVRHPRDAFNSQTFLENHWQAFGYTDMPDYPKACRDYDLFIDILGSRGAQIDFLPGLETNSPDSIYIHDPAEIIGDGIVLCRMGKKARRDESERIERFCLANGIRVLGRVCSPGIIEGGDIIWLDDHTLAIGEGYRTNREGIEQLRKMTEEFVHEVIRTPLPHWRGQSDVLHLMSLISPVSRHLAVIFRPLLGVPFLNELERRDFKLIDVPQEELDSLGCNVLALSPDCCIMADGNPITRQRIEACGIEVLVYPAAEISLKGQGGPTCLTRPLRRSADQESRRLFGFRS